MAALDQHFYHNSIRTYTALFGALFNKLKIERSDGKVITIPLAYSSRQKFDMIQKREANEAHYKTSFPRMGFLFTGFRRDDSRKENKKLFLRGSANEFNAVQKQLNRVPYTFSYDLYLLAKDMDDFCQMLEQISVWFNPSLTVNITDNQDLAIDSAVKITMLDPNIEDSFEGLMEDEKRLSATLNFEVEGYLYMPTSEQGLIETVNVNYYDLDTSVLIDSDTFTEK